MSSSSSSSLSNKLKTVENPPPLFPQFQNNMPIPAAVSKIEQIGEKIVKNDSSIKADNVCVINKTSTADTSKACSAPLTPLISSAPSANNHKPSLKAVDPGVQKALDWF